MPVRPFAPTDPKTAVKLIKSEQKKLPPPGVTTLRGRWSGALTCQDGVPQLELKRKLAA